MESSIFSYFMQNVIKLPFTAGLHRNLQSCHAEGTCSLCISFLARSEEGTSGLEGALFMDIPVTVKSWCLVFQCNRNKVHMVYQQCQAGH